jgi:putative DNA primase/helicase
MTFLEIALGCTRRGWHVFPCKPKSKELQLNGGFHNASNDESQIRDWWSRFPNANVAIALRKSGLAVLDCDHGNVCRTSSFLSGRIDSPFLLPSKGSLPH